MNRLLMTAAALALSAAGISHAVAQSASQDITINANVTPFCTIGDQQGITTEIPTNASGLTTGNAPSPTIDVVCNNAANVSLKSAKGAATLNGVNESLLTAVPGFRSAIQYTATIDGGAGPVPLDTSSGMEGVSIAGSFNGGAAATDNTAITIVPETSPTPLVSGHYTDTLTVTVTPL